MIYTIIDDYIFLDYLSLLLKALHKNDNNFENTKFKDLYGLVIPDIFMNIMSCHEFAKSTISTVILTWRNYLFSYYLSKGFVIIETEVSGFDNIPTTVKKSALVILHQWDSLLTYKSAIPSVFNTLNKIIISRNVYKKYVYNFYYGCNVDLYNLEFNYFFKQCLPTR